ncbi:hypothetical protein XENTR_v10005203 [Xenopus tropicalis]|nr:hypothetical protein XENTR_v10005203 [Xenopus tropicalis]
MYIKWRTDLQSGFFNSVSIITLHRVTRQGRIYCFLETYILQYQTVHKKSYNYLMLHFTILQVEAHLSTYRF